MFNLATTQNRFKLSRKNVTKEISVRFREHFFLSFLLFSSFQFLKARVKNVNRGLDALFEISFTSLGCTFENKRFSAGAQTSPKLLGSEPCLVIGFGLGLSQGQKENHGNSASIVL